MLMPKDKEMIAKGLLYHTAINNEKEVTRILDWLTADEVKEITEYITLLLEKK